MKPLTLQLTDAHPEHLFADTPYCEVKSVLGDVTLRVSREKNGAHVWMNFDATAQGLRINATMLDKNMARIARDQVHKAIGSLKVHESVVLNQVMFSVREARLVERALSRYVEEG